MSDETRGMDFVAGFLVGALVGAAAALIFAPQSGADTRTLIKDKGLELRDQADTLADEARKRAEALQAQAKERAGGIQTQVKRAVEEGRTAAAKTKEDLLSRVAPQPPAGEVQAE
jgi:gas vesicle protein